MSSTETANAPSTSRWSYGGRQFRQSAKTRTWTVAEQVRRDVEAQYKAADPSKPVEQVAIRAETRKTIQQAVDLFVSDKESQGISSGVLTKYRRELNRLADFLAQRGRFFPHEIQLADLTEFRSDWMTRYPSSITRAKVQERMRGYFRYCYASKMMDRVPQLSSIRIDQPPTLPLSESEYEALLKAVPGQFPAHKAQRVHALIQMMRYSGLAIRDVVTLERRELQYDEAKSLYRVVTKRQKTGTHVSVPVPPAIAKEVLSTMELNRHPDYVFWNTGVGTPQTAVTHWQHDLRQTFRAAGQPEGHPHQLRDTFALSLLEKGVPLEEVSKLLGHESIKTTEKYYAKWVKARQDRLDSLVTATWT